MWHCFTNIVTTFHHHMLARQGFILFIPLKKFTQARALLNMLIDRLHHHLELRMACTDSDRQVFAPHLPLLFLSHQPDDKHHNSAAWQPSPRFHHSFKRIRGRTLGVFKNDLIAIGCKPLGDRKFCPQGDMIRNREAKRRTGRDWGNRLSVMQKRVPLPMPQVV